MTVWIKSGVVGDLNPPTQKGLGRVAAVYERTGCDLYVTSIREGNHMAGSFHYIGQAFDIRKSPTVSVDMIKDILGPRYDVLEHSTHIHIEYDPK